MTDNSGHWHYAVTISSAADPSHLHTTVGPEENLTLREAKEKLQPVIREAQGRVRYQDGGNVVEPADYWVASDLRWIQFPEGPLAMHCVYACAGDCTASALAHQRELAEYLGKHGLDVVLETPGSLN